MVNDEVSRGLAMWGCSEIAGEKVAESQDEKLGRRGLCGSCKEVWGSGSSVDGIGVNVGFPECFLNDNVVDLCGCSQRDRVTVFKVESRCHRPAMSARLHH